MPKFDAKKFVFHETFTNANGKTSGSGFIGVILGLIAGAAFIAASTILLGVRKIGGQINAGKVIDAEAEIEKEKEKHPLEKE